MIKVSEVDVIYESIWAGAIASQLLVFEHYLFQGWQCSPALSQTIRVMTMAIPFGVVCHRAGRRDLVSAALLMSAMGSTAMMMPYAVELMVEKWRRGA